MIKPHFFPTFGNYTQMKSARATTKIDCTVITMIAGKLQTQFSHWGLLLGDYLF